EDDCASSAFGIVRVTQPHSARTPCSLTPFPLSSSPSLSPACCSRSRRWHASVLASPENKSVGGKACGSPTGRNRRAEPKPGIQHGFAAEITGAHFGSDSRGKRQRQTPVWDNPLAFFIRRNCGGSQPLHEPSVVQHRSPSTISGARVHCFRQFVFKNLPWL